MSDVSSSPTKFSDRIKPRLSRTPASDQSVKVVEAENDFPFANVDRVRVGSAHTECEPRYDADHIALMLRISTHILRRYEPDLLPAKVSVDYKSGVPSTIPDSSLATHTAEVELSISTSRHFQPSFVDRQWIKDLYLCVLVQGNVPSGVRGYCYFGVFADRLIDFVDRYQPNQPFNPNQLNGVVLARSTGEPSDAIREFMRHRFSFACDCSILEISRRG